jgi:hypothetical protein
MQERRIYHQLYVPDAFTEIYVDELIDPVEL